MTGTVRDVPEPIPNPPAFLSAGAATPARHVAGAWRHGRGLLVAALAACSGSAPEVHLSLVHSDLEFPRASALHLPAVMATAAGGPGWIDVRGFLPLPDHCDVVRARVEADEAELTLRLTARDDQGHTNPCGGSAGEVAFGVYDARIAPVRSGTYRLRVVYDYGLGRKRTGMGGDSLFAERMALDVQVLVE